MSTATKAWFILTIIAGSMILIGQSFWGRQGLLWALVLALVANGLIYFLADSRVFRLFPGSPLEGKDPWKVLRICGELSSKARIHFPNIVLYNTQSPQAFVVGRSSKSATLFITLGLVSRLNEKELRAVIAYQLACIKRQETFVFSVGSFLSGCILSTTAIFDTLFRWIVGAKKESHSYQSQLFTTLLAPVIAFLIRASVPKANYFEIDALAASWLEDPKELAEALWKLDSYSHTMPLNIPASTSPLFIVNPLPNKGWKKHLIVQPPTEDRIKKLIGYYPI